jgi:6-phosphogluconolactonase
MFIQKAAMVSAARGRFTVALSGGDTPAGLYTLLALPEFAGRVDWSRIHLFWGDERCVPATDPRNNAVNALKQFAHLPLPPANIHRVNTALAAQQCALDYENEIRRHFGAADAVFDLILLGVGTDGHTASLFPMLSWM